MREILFRGKRLDNGEWVEGSLIIWSYGGYSIEIGRLDTPMESVIPDTVGQYTGLTDNVQQRIFEGDIVSILPDDGEMGVIKWADDEAMFVLEADGWYANFDNYYSTDLEVIGNIHDNADWLKGEKNEFWGNDL